jgi:hypothetical protein
VEGKVWIGIAFATEYRLMLSFMIGSQEAYLAEPLIASTEERLKAGSWPVWVSDGLEAYGEALKGRHWALQYYPRTGKRGRPRRPGWLPVLNCGTVKWSNRETRGIQ